MHESYGSTTIDGDVTPLPKKELLVLSCVMISEAISITMLFPFVGKSTTILSIVFLLFFLRSCLSTNDYC